MKTTIREYKGFLLSKGLVELGVGMTTLFALALGLALAVGYLERFLNLPLANIKTAFARGH